MKYITVKLTEDQAVGILNALSNNWYEMEDTEYREGELLKMAQETNKSNRKYNAFMKRIMNKIRAELAK